MIVFWDFSFLFSVDLCDFLSVIQTQTKIGHADNPGPAHKRSRSPSPNIGYVGDPIDDQEQIDPNSSIIQCEDSPNVLGCNESILPSSAVMGQEQLDVEECDS